MLISHNIAVYRKRAGMSQEDLAERLHVSRQTISKWESGLGYPETEKLLSISKELNVSLDYLFSEQALEVVE